MNQNQHEPNAAIDANNSATRRRPCKGDRGEGVISAAIAVLIMAFLGVVIGGIVIGMYLPIFKMGAVV